MSKPKPSGSSWLSTVMKKVFRSAIKEKKISSSDDKNHEDRYRDNEKSNGKRAWMFKKPSNHVTRKEHCSKKSIENGDKTSSVIIPTDAAGTMQVDGAGGRQATAAVSRAAGASARAAILRQHDAAAIVIQTAFRAYLARRALRALKGLVKIQAMVKGHNVRSKTKRTLYQMEAMMRVQTRMLDQRSKLQCQMTPPSHIYDVDPNSLCRKSMSGKGGRMSYASEGEAETKSRRDPWKHGFEEEEEEERSPYPNQNLIKDIQFSKFTSARHLQQQRFSSVTAASFRRAHNFFPPNSPVTPPPPKTTPRLRSCSPRYGCDYESVSSGRSGARAGSPSYMATTESTRARFLEAENVQLQAEKARIVRKRLSFPANIHGGDMAACAYRGGTGGVGGEERLTELGMVRSRFERNRARILCGYDYERKLCKDSHPSDIPHTTSC